MCDVHFTHAQTHDHMYQSTIKLPFEMSTSYKVLELPLMRCMHICGND